MNEKCKLEILLPNCSAGTVDLIDLLYFRSTNVIVTRIVNGLSVTSYRLQNTVISYQNLRSLDVQSNVIIWFSGLTSVCVLAALLHEVSQ